MSLAQAEADAKALLVKAHDEALKLIHAAHDEAEKLLTEFFHRQKLNATADAAKAETTAGAALVKEGNALEGK